MSQPVEQGSRFVLVDVSEENQSEKTTWQKVMPVLDLGPPAIPSVDMIPRVTCFKSEEHSLAVCEAVHEMLRLVEQQEHSATDRIPLSDAETSD